MKIFYNPNCSKSLAALKILEQYNQSFEGIKYLTEGITAKEVLEIAHILNLKVHQFVRSKEQSYKTFDIDWNDNTQAASAIEKSPILLSVPLLLMEIGELSLGRLSY